MNKKGFTLIELLAVILLLGIIALIAIPTASKLIDEAKKNAFRVTNQNIANTASDSCSRSFLYGNSIIKEYSINNGNLTPSLEIKGEMPTNGTVLLNDDCEVALATNNDKYCAIKKYTDDRVQVGVYDESKGCTIDDKVYSESDLIDYTCTKEEKPQQPSFVYEEKINVCSNRAMTETSASDFTFDETTKTITEYIGTNTEIVLPCKINNVNVENIESGVFSDKGIKKITFNDNIKTIGNSAFQNNSLTEIYLPKSLTLISNAAFSTNNISILRFSEGLTTLQYNVFENNDIREVYFPNSLINLNPGNFMGNANLKTMVLNNKILSINGVAAGLDLDYLYLDGNNVSISSTSASSIKKLVIGDGIVNIGNEAFKGLGITSLLLGNNVVNIGSSAFYGNNIDSLCVPNSVTTIGYIAFASNSLLNVTIPSSVTMIGEAAFAGNKTTIDSFIIGNGLTENNKFLNSDSINNLRIDGNDLTLNSLGATTINNFTIGDGIIGISDMAFEKVNISQLKLGKNITKIGNTSFDSCGITNLTISNGIKEIGNGSFSNNHIANLNIPDSVTKIGQAAFENNGNMNNVYIGKGVNFLGSGALESNIIESLIINGNNLEISYQNKIEVHNLTIGTGVISVTSSVFDNAKLETLSLGNDLITIEQQAFRNNNLTTLIIPKNVKTIGISAFENNQLTKIEIPNSVITLGDHSFGNNGEVNEIIIGNGLTKAVSPFSGNSVKKIIIDGNDLTLSSNFGSGLDLEGADVIIKSGVTNIASGALSTTSSTPTKIINSVTIDSPTLVTDSAIFLYYNIKKLSLLNINSIGTSAFASLGLTELTLPDSLITIGTSAFYGNDLTSIVIPNNVVTIGGSAFSDNKLVNVYIPNSVTTLDFSSFYDTTGTIEIDNVPGYFGSSFDTLSATVKYLRS